MRNLKKILAVVCVVAMMASIAVFPALAAGFTYETEATTLNTVGLMAGMNLGDEVTRIQGLTFAIKAAGKDAAAQALTDAEVATILANVTDAADIPAWGLKYAAYAVKTGMTTGVDSSVAPKVKFAPLQGVSGDSMLVWMLKSMSYTDAGTATAWETAVTTAKILSLTQGYTFHGKATLIRDDVAGILFGAAKNGVNKDGKTFIQSLIDAGFITAQAAATAGLTAPLAPAKLAVSSVSATNLMEINVVFNGGVDKTTLEDTDFTIDGETVDSVALKADGVTAVVTMAAALANETSYDLTIKGIKGSNGTDLADTTVSFETKDYSLPEATAIEFTGPQNAKITFTEPVSEVNSTAVGASISVDNGIYIGSVAAWNGNSVDVDFGTELSAGTHSIQVKNFADYAPYTMISKTFNITYAKVAVAPVASISEAKQTYVKIKFDRPVKGIDPANFYQTYSSWKPLHIVDNDGVAVTTTDFYSEIKLVFSDGDVNDRPIPVGTTNVVVVGDKVEDRWGNKIKTDVSLPVTVTADTTAPTVSKIKVESQTQIKIYFSEDLNATEAVKEANYTITNSKGTALHSYDFTATYSNADDEYVVTIDFDATQDPGDYTIKIVGMKDTSLASNLMGDVTMSYSMSDKSAVDMTDVTVTAVDASDILYVKYPEEVATTGTGSALDKANYLWNAAAGVPAKLVDDVKLSMFTSKIVKMQFPAGTNLVGSDLTIGRIADKVGNLPSNSFQTLVAGIAEEAAPVITAIKKIDIQKYELTVDQELKSVKASGITFDLDNGAAPAAEDVAAISYVNDGDKTKITVTVKASGKDDNTVVLDTATAVLSTVAGNIKGITGVYMDNQDYTADGSTGGVAWSDGMAPKIVKDADDDKIVYGYDFGDANQKLDHIVIQYSEELSANTISKYTYTVAGYTVTAAGLSSAADLAAVKAAIDAGSATTAFADATGFFVVLTVKEADNTDDDATPAVTQKLSVEDVAGNALAAQDPIEMVSVIDTLAK